MHYSFFNIFQKFNRITNGYVLLNNDSPNETKPINNILFIIKGIFYDQYGDADAAFNYYANGFFDPSNSTKSNNIIKWRHIIQDNYINNNPTLDIFKRFNGDNCLTTRNNTEILETAWTQWATLIEYYFYQATVKDIKIILAAMQCYILASELIDHKKNDVLIAKVCASQNISYRIGIFK